MHLVSDYILITEFKKIIISLKSAKKKNEKVIQAGMCLGKERGSVESE